MAGASIDLTITIRDSSNNTLTTVTVSGTTNSSGKVTLSSSGTTNNRNNARFRITNASNALLTWDGSKPSATAS